MNNTPPPDDSAARLLAYEEVTIQLFDNKDQVQTETIKVRELKVREWAQAIRFIETEDDDGLTAFVCGKSADWVMSLTPASYRCLVERVKARNLDFFAVVEDRMNRRIGRITNLPKAAIDSLIDRTSQPSSPNSRLRPA